MDSFLLSYNATIFFFPNLVTITSKKQYSAQKLYFCLIFTGVMILEIY